MSHVDKLPPSESASSVVLTGPAPSHVPKSSSPVTTPLWTVLLPGTDRIAMNVLPTTKPPGVATEKKGLGAIAVQGRLRGTHPSTSSTTLAMPVNHVDDIVGPSVTGGSPAVNAGALRMFDAEVALLASLHEGAFLAA